MLRRGVLALVLPCLAIAMLAGCSRTRPLTPAESTLPPGFPDHTASEINSRLALQPGYPESFRARAQLTLTSPQRSGRFSAEIRERGGDSLYMSVSPGLGIEAVRVLVTRDSVFVYDRLDNRVRYGSADEASEIMPIPIDGDALVRSLKGALRPDPATAWIVRADSLTYTLSNPGRTERFVIDPALWRVIRYERLTHDGSVLERREFASFADVEGHILPRRLVVRVPPHETTVVLTYRSIEPNPESISFDLRVSDGARWTPVSD